MYYSNKTFNIKTNQVETLDVNLEAGSVKKQLYIIPVEKIPYGIGDGLPGNLVVCEGIDGGVEIKAWKFLDELSWNECSLGGGIHVDQFSSLIEIKEPRCYSGSRIWNAAKKSAWSTPGYVQVFFNGTPTWEDKDIAFSDFMNKNYPV